MGDEEVGHPQLLLNLLHGVEQADAQGGVDHTGGFVHHNQLGIHGQNPGNGHPLPLTAGQVSRVLVHEILHRCQTHQLQQTGNLLVQLGNIGDFLMPPDGVGDDVKHHQRRIQGLIGILVNQLHILAESIPVLPFQLGYLLAAETIGAGGVAAQPRNDLAQRGLAAAGFSQHAQGLSGPDGQAHIPQDGNRFPMLLGEGFTQIGNFNDGFHDHHLP